MLRAPQAHNLYGTTRTRSCGRDEQFLLLHSKHSSFFFHGAGLIVNHNHIRPCNSQVARKTPRCFGFKFENRAVNSGSSEAAGATSVSTATEEEEAVEEPVEAEEEEESCIKVKAVVTVVQTISGLIAGVGIGKGLDDIQDLLGKTLLLELVSAHVDPAAEQESARVEGFAHRAGKSDQRGEVKYEAEFEVPLDFGDIGAILVENEHQKEMFIKKIVLHGFPDGDGVVNISCASWIHSKHKNQQKRVFFTTKSYLPSDTPSGLRRLREEELMALRGDGEGERQVGDRIYDYDVYNDIGDSDADPLLARPAFGGPRRPYPRRCRTGRPPCEIDPTAEKRVKDFYVPRDEVFSEIKQLTFSAKTLYSVFHALVPSLGSVIADGDAPFPFLSSIDSLFREGISIPPLSKLGFWNTMLPRLFKAIKDGPKDVLRFHVPKAMERDKLFWFRDEEFARQTLAGVNPYSIRLVTEWPLKSELDPEKYGPPESGITTEMIEEEIGGIMKMDKAIKQKKLFILDYHDFLLPFVSKVRGLEGTTLYGSRALFFLTPGGTLRPLAIELTRPPMDGKPQWKQVFRPGYDSTSRWLWKLAKAHLLAHDTGLHQLNSHWLRAHAVTEPFIIATNRQLSVLHPIYRLLHPHFRYTMEINALAREALINAGGIIESTFTPGKYAMDISSAAYAQLWRFDHQSLPNDLISRGMAVEDVTSPHGLKLTIEDYPFANDGLMMWDIIQQWITDYVNHYYPDASQIESDLELQAWWTEIRTVGHADKKDEPWWPELKRPTDLIEILTTMVWIASGHHAAVNFGQYTFGGYFPNRPTIARVKMPTEDPTDEEWKLFLEKPERMLMQTFPSKLQATRVMAVLDVLSNHSPDEEYLGENIEPAWEEDPHIKAAFERFSGRLKELEGIIDERNANFALKNRCGAGVLPYELLKPFSEPGVTGQGVPYSISI